MYKKVTWITILTLAIATTIILSVGFITSLKLTSSANENTSESNKQDVTVQTNKMLQLDSKSYNILVLGDSLAKGTGDEKGEGFVKDFSNLWKPNTTKEIKVNNIAVNGDVSAGLLKIVQNEETLKAVENSQIIFISIGGNEVKRFQSSEVSASSTDVKTVEDNYLNNLRNIFKVIRNQNKNSIIVFIGLYNPYGKNMTLDKMNLLNDWNYKTEQLVASDSNAVFIPTYDLFKYNLGSYLSADNFHPNAAGYDAISKRIFESLKNYKGN